MKVYVVQVTGCDWGDEVAPHISNNRVLKTRALAMIEAKQASDKFAKKYPDAKVENYSSFIHVNSRDGGQDRSYSIEELELVD